MKPLSLALVFQAMKYFCAFFPNRNKCGAFSEKVPMAQSLASLEINAIPARVGVM
jgi:hypothetical protein